MDSTEMRQLAEVVADVLTERGLVKTVAPLRLCPLVLTVAEFGVAINRSPKVVRRRISEGFIDRKHVFGPPYTIAREALAKFKVPFPLAVERLAAVEQAALHDPSTPSPMPERSAA